MNTPGIHVDITASVIGTYSVRFDSLDEARAFAQRIESDQPGIGGGFGLPVEIDDTWQELNFDLETLDLTADAHTIDADYNYVEVAL